MKPRQLAFILGSIAIQAPYTYPQLGQICHPDPEYVKYNYAGLWEKDSDGNLFCNYQQFMPESEAAASLREQPEYTEIEADEYENGEQDDELEYEIEAYDEDDYNDVEVY